MRNRLTALLFAGLLAFGVAACESDSGGTDVEAPADGGVADPADPAADPAGGAASDPMEDPALEPTE